MKKELLKYLNNLKSGTVTKSTAGGGAGSTIKIEFNEEDLRILYIECAWRIENKNKVIATSTDGIEALTGLIAKSARMLEGKIVESIILTPFYDLCVSFSDGFCIRIFCVFSYDYEFDTNWQLWIPTQNLSYEITNHFKIKKGKYN
ncbi:hypothetical protein FACS1894177_09660 [Bacteroidia bacterium]|nr:hypothetical protein FACS1894177_09660 [Bacteroidia bacterium]